MQTSEKQILWAEFEPFLAEFVKRYSLQTCSINLTKMMCHCTARHEIAPYD